MENHLSNQSIDQGSQQGQGLFDKAQEGQNLFSNAQGGQGLFGNAQGGQNLFGNTQGGQGLFDNTQRGQNLFGNVQGGQNLFSNGQAGQGLFGNAQKGQNLFGNTQGGQGLFGNPQYPRDKQKVVKAFGNAQVQDLSQNYRMVSNVPEPKHGKLLWQETKKYKIFTYLNLHLHSYSFDKKVGNSPNGKKVRRIYTVHRKDIRRNSLSAELDNPFGLTNPEIVRILGAEVKHFKELEIKTKQRSDYNLPVISNWMKIFHSADFSNIKTLSLQMGGLYILKRNNGLFSTLKSVFPNVEKLRITFLQNHGNNSDISTSDWTLNFIRRLRLLKALRIEFTYSTFINDKHLGAISKALQSHLYSLEAFEIVFANERDDITIKAIQHLWESLNFIPNLKHLMIKGIFTQRETRHAALAAICNVINRKCDTLVSLEIDVGSIENIGHGSYQQLCNALVSVLPILQNLRLEFISSQTVNDESMTLLGDMLRNGSPSLKNLDLQLGSQDVTTKGAKDFARGMKEGIFPMMEKLFISLYCGGNLTIDGLYEIAEAIPEAFPNLKELRFLNTGRSWSVKGKVDDELSEKATQMLKKRLPNLSKKFRMDW